MGDLLGKFQRHLKKEFPFLQPVNSRLLLAVSGGVDSVVMTDLFARSGYNVVIAHCNFQLRAEESERDEQFVRQLGAKYNAEVLVKRFDTLRYAQAKKISIQEAARELRYDWFREIVEGEWSMVNGEFGETKPADTQNMFAKRPKHAPVISAGSHSPFTIHHSPYIITAHHANDSIETLLLNFLRGTGISGLHGIPARQGNILRPMLFAKRDEIVAYATENNLAWVEDSSNATDKYARNFIRLNMLPAAKEVFSSVEDNLLQNIERFKEAEILYSQSVTLHKKKLLEKKGNEWHIPVLKLQKTEPLQTMVWEISKDFGFTAAQAPEIVKLLAAGNGSYIASPTHRIIKNRAWLIIAPLQAETAQHILIEEGDTTIMFEGGSLEIADCRLQIADSGMTVHHSPLTIHDSRFTIDDSPFTTHHSPLTIHHSSFTAVLDASQIQFPLLLRRWKQGDYFYPLGMQKKKKLSKFFIDLKLSKTDKEKVWVLESDKRVLWVVGLRIDDRFKVTPSTQKICVLTLITN